MARNKERTDLEIDADAALYMADSYLALADRALQDYAKRRFGELDGDTRGPVYIAVSSMVFALEVYLKTIIFTLSDRTIRGHDLESIWLALPKQIRADVEYKHAANYQCKAGDWIPLHVISSRLRGESKIRKVYIPHGTALDIIRGHSTAYEAGRYGYEYLKPPNFKTFLRNIPGLQVLCWICREYTEVLWTARVDAIRGLGTQGGKWSVRLHLPKSRPLVQYP